MAFISWLLNLFYLNGGSRPGQHFDFLALPGELRNQIYDLTLTSDPPRLYRGHKESCKWYARRPELVPGASWVNDNGRRLPGCRCWARTGLALLLANRQINREASPIFWSQNHFSFSGVDSFTDLVGSALRPQYRQMIPHVTIYLGPAGRRDMGLPPLRFWDVLFKCKGLRTLEIPPYRRRIQESSEMELVYAASASWDRMTRELPYLSNFSWSYIRNRTGMSSNPCITCASRYPCRITKCFDLTVLSPAQLRRSGPFTYEDTDFGCKLWKHATRTLTKKALAPELDDRLGGTLVGGSRPDEYRLAAGMIGRKNTFDATLPEAIPTSWTVKFSLLPVRPEAVVDSALHAAIRENSKKAEKEADSA